MTYYIAEIRFNRESHKRKRERRMKRRNTIRLLGLVLASIVVLVTFLTVPTMLSSRRSDAIDSLEELSEVISSLPDDAFKNPKTAVAHKGSLCNKIKAVINQIEAEAFNGALNKLENDMRKSIIDWIDPTIAADLIALIDEIIDIIESITEPTPDFSIGASPDLLTIEQGDVGISTITITSLNGFNHSVDLGVTSPPISGVTVTLDPTQVTPPPDGSVNSTLTVEVASTVVPATYTITVTGTNDSLAHSTNISLETTPTPPVPDFSIDSNPSFLVIHQGGSSASVITVTSLEGFNQPVDLTVTSQPITGVNFTLNPSRVIPPSNSYATSVLTINVASDVMIDSYSITVQGTSGSLQHIVEILLEVTAPPVPPTPDFSLAAFPTSLAIQRGRSAIAAIVVVSLRDFNQPVDLAVTSAPIPSVVVTINPSKVTPPPNDFVTATLIIDVDSTVSPNDYEVTVVGTSDALEHSVAILLGITVETTPPEIVSVYRLPEQPSYNETVTVSATVTDVDSGVESVLLGYSGGDTWKNVTMALEEEGQYEASISTFPFAVSVEYRVYASDSVGNEASSDIYSYVVADPYPPHIGIPVWSPEEPDAGMDVVVNITATEPPDGSGVKNVTLWYNVTGEWQSLEMTPQNANWTATIPRQSGDATVTFYVEAYDGAANCEVTTSYKYAVKPAPWPLAWLAGIALGVAALTGAVLYVLYRRRKKKAVKNPKNPASKPVVSFYVPSKILIRSGHTSRRNG